MKFSLKKSNFSDIIITKDNAHNMDYDTLYECVDCAVAYQRYIGKVFIRFYANDEDVNFLCLWGTMNIFKFHSDSLFEFKRLPTGSQVILEQQG